MAVECGPLDGVPEAEVVTIAADGRAGRPAPRFGTLVHAALATVPLDASPRAREALVATHGRIVGATAEEVSAAVAVVAAVLRSPAGRGGADAPSAAGAAIASCR